MTTPANHGSNSGANQPEDDDPFGYLYADGQAAGATPPAQGGGYGYPGPTAGGQPGAQPGVPRTSYNQVRTVGERTYGGQRGAQVPQQQPPAYQAQYQAPEALQAGGYGVPPQQGQTTASIPAPGGHGGHGGGGGSSRKGMLIAAVAVVAAVAIGIGAAVTFGDKDKDKNDKGNAAGGQQSAQPQNSSSAQPSPSTSPEAPLPKADASGAGMSLTGGAHLEGTVPGAKSAGGQYVGGLNAAGAAATWTVDVAKAGQYKLKMVYGVPGKDASTTLTINGEAQSRPVNMKNFSQAKPGEWDKGWTNTWSLVTLKQGTNTIKISCEAGNQCEVNLDQLWLEKG
ncbi:CBM35 domain-containing protein [Streptomyces sp. NBC_01443]|uniref:CBM35 domain-containing protein n=1 Tax=Streptomyces sp. NBC_01443 TaxID=2903868 RepID=UPI00224DE6D2|nr:CBM35 domain-containing protein [Streptomyces sp. NBC_01443]MCX4629159.1 carbohydrate-binding protein [Streptomyces sp. NBC_01443]